MKKLILLCTFFLLPFSVCLAQKTEEFKYTVTFDGNFSLGRTYSFSIFKVIDAREDKKKPIGSVLGLSLKPLNVGNDALSECISVFLQKNNRLFDSAKKFVMVLNDIRLRYIGGYSMSSGKLQDLEIIASIDYYSLNGSFCELIYQQQRKYVRSVKSIAKTSKGINLTFSETIKSALTDFGSQLEIGELYTLDTMPLDSLLKR